MDGDADERRPDGLGPDQWDAVYQLVLDELRNISARRRAGHDDLAAVPVQPVAALGAEDDIENPTDQLGNGPFVREDGL